MSYYKRNAPEYTHCGVMVNRNPNSRRTAKINFKFAMDWWPVLQRQPLETQAIRRD